MAVRGDAFADDRNAFNRGMNRGHEGRWRPRPRPSPKAPKASREAPKQDELRQREPDDDAPGEAAVRHQLRRSSMQTAVDGQSAVNSWLDATAAGAAARSM